MRGLRGRECSNQWLLSQERESGCVQCEHRDLRGMHREFAMHLAQQARVQHLKPMRTMHSHHSVQRRNPNLLVTDLRGLHQRCSMRG